MLLDLADLTLQEQPVDNLMVAISWACYNSSYTTAAKPIKSLEFHYTMMWFLKMAGIPWLPLANQNCELKCIYHNDPGLIIYT